MSDSDPSSSGMGRKRLRAGRHRLDSESSDDSLIVSRRRRAKRIESSQSSDSGSEVETRRRRPKGADAKPVIASESESDSGSLGDGLACPICLGKLYETTLQGRPESCEHTFCIECITAWSKNNSTCPLCRNVFSSIKVSLRGAVLEELPVKKVVPEVNEADNLLNDILCLICRLSDREDTLLLCDECDDAYHCACLSPPLMSVPIGQWFCPRCQEQNVDDDDDEDDGNFIPDGFHALYLPRTRATERVRRTVQSTRRTASTRQAGGSSGGRRRASTPRTSTKRRATSGRKRRSTGATRKKTTRRKRTTRRRKGGRRLTILRKAYAASTDHQWRIARSLGLSDRSLHKLNRNNVSFPVLSTDEPSTSRGTSHRSEPASRLRSLAGVAPSLTIFGSNNEYVPQDSSDDERVVSHSTKEDNPPPSTSSTLDFLGGLLEKQSVLLDKKSELRMDSQGTLRLVGKDSISGKTSVQRRSTESATSSDKVQKAAQPTPRAASSSLEYDTRYKPQRISRVDEACVSTYADTIEDVVKLSQSQQMASKSTRPSRTEPSRSRASAPASAARDRTTKETPGWINSLRLTVPTVINSLSIFQDLDEAQPSGSSSNSTGNHLRIEIKSEYVQVKEEPREHDERSNENCQRDQKHRSHHDESRREKKRDWLQESRNSTKHRRSLSHERDRNRRRSRSRSPRDIKKERVSRERSLSHGGRPSDHKSKYRRSRSPDSSHRKENSHRSVKRERPSPESADPTNSRGVLGSDLLLDAPEPVGLESRDEVATATNCVRVDLSRVKVEPVEYSPGILGISEHPHTSSVAPEVTIKEELKVQFEAAPSPTNRVASRVGEMHSNQSTDRLMETMPIKREFIESFQETDGAVSGVSPSFGSNDAPAIEPNTNTAHIEGYSSGMDSEESLSDVERAVPGMVMESKPDVKKEPRKYVKYFVPREKFKDAVIKETGPYLKKFYKKHQISKEDYKEIFKKVIKKVCTSSSEKKRLVCTKAIHRLCHTYVKRARIQIKLDCKFGDTV